VRQVKAARAAAFPPCVRGMGASRGCADDRRSRTRAGGCAMKLQAVCRSMEVCSAAAALADTEAAHGVVGRRRSWPWRRQRWELQRKLRQRRACGKPMSSSRWSRTSHVSCDGAARRKVKIRGSLLGLIVTLSLFSCPSCASRELVWIVRVCASVDGARRSGAAWAWLAFSWKAWRGERLTFVGGAGRQEIMRGVRGLIAE
jgi:hypothetical protein